MNTARLNSDQIRFRRDAAKADLAQARATKIMQEATAADADLAYTRQAKLRQGGAVSELALPSKGRGSPRAPIREPT